MQEVLINGHQFIGQNCVEVFYNLSVAFHCQRLPVGEYDSILGTDSGPSQTIRELWGEKNKGLKTI